MTVRYLILGAGGQLGRAFRQFLEQQGYEVVACGRAEVDVSSPGALRRVFSATRPDVVINCAAYNHVDLAEREWEQALSVNGTAVKNLALLTREHGAVLVHYSTDYVFDGEKGAPYMISDLPRPLSRYGKSKLIGEEFLRALGDRYYLIRTSWVFGPGKENFITKVLAWAGQREELRIVTDQVSCPTYTRDLVEGTLRLLATGRYGVYHLTNTGYCSRYEWARYILERVGWRGRLVPARSADFGLPAPRPHFSALDNSPLPELLNWEMPPWQDATRRFLAELGFAE
ncbi:dTDP-4-dehydrorhamnose reductase [Thermanaeromonas toyohensis ToBE]|uniref:dTDP-4-dehydrorhamnose reductase n=1 Tax=Thermanaeromonas toyohensis ToBE TaxID=698762 RepID=A0A1W1VTE6_9FIRM|nr:dTDP-4-dehydrorhamnose reductase [Thermanaeromonas toyohensis ToBE]